MTKDFLKQHYRKFLAITLILLFGQINFAHAQDYLSNFSLNGLLSVIDGIGYLIGYIASLFVNIGGSLVNWALDLNSQVLKNSTVEIGWTVSRDIANLGFVLAIILIAFATILRFENYAMKKTLVKLIAAAVLVNFSLVGAGLFIDLTGVITNFFINKATSYDQSSIGEGLAGAFQVQKLLWPTDTEDAIKKMVSGLAEDPNAHIPFTASVIFVAIFTTIIAISLISLATMLYLRYIWLLMLLILMPIAWMAWIWPDLNHITADWWKRFLKWTFFAPAITFFIYLALSIVEPSSNNSILEVSFKAPPGITLKDFGSLLGRMLSVLGILYGGMYFAFDMGIAGAGAGMAVAKGVKNTLTGAVGLGGMGLGYAGGRLGQKLLSAGAGEKKDSYAQRFATTLSGIPGLRTTGAAINRMVTDSQAQVEKYQKEELSGLTNDQFLARMNVPQLFQSDKQMAAMANEAGKRKLLSAKDEGGKPLIAEVKVQDMLRAADKLGTADGILSARPDLAPLIGRTVAEASKLTKEENADQVPVDLYQNVEFVQNIKIGHLETIGRKKDTADKEIYIRTLNSELLRLSKKLADTSISDEDRRLATHLATQLKGQANFIRKSSAWPGHGIDTETLKKFMASKEIRKMKKEEGEGEEEGTNKFTVKGFGPPQP